MSIKRMILCAGAAFLLFSCSGGRKAASKSMEQIYSESGRPVEVRTVHPESFSVYAEYPAEFRARTQSAAYAKTSDVVRSINVRVGQKVTRDQIVVTFSSDNANYQQAKLSYDSARKIYDRMKALFAASGVSKQDFDNAQTQYEIARETLRAAEETVYARSPIDGFITQLNVQTSANVRPGDALFTVSNQDGFETYFYVMPSEISDIRTGEKAIVRNGQETIEGRVTEVSLNLDPVRKAFLVKAFFAGKPKTIVSGMDVDVSVEVYKNSSAIVMSQKELVNSGDSVSAYVVRNGSAVRQDVVFGRRQGLHYEVISGIENGDKLVMTGAQELYDGEKVNVVSSAVAMAD